MYYLLQIVILSLGEATQALALVYSVMDLNSNPFGEPSFHGSVVPFKEFVSPDRLNDKIKGPNFEKINKNEIVCIHFEVMLGSTINGIDSVLSECDFRIEIRSLDMR